MTRRNTGLLRPFSALRVFAQRSALSSRLPLVTFVFTRRIGGARGGEVAEKRIGRGGNAGDAALIFGARCFEYGGERRRSMMVGRRAKVVGGWGCGDGGGGVEEGGTTL